MAFDFENAHVMVRDETGTVIGRVDVNKFVRSSDGALLYRIDGDQVYTIGVTARLVGVINDNGDAISPQGGGILHFVVA